MTGSFTKYFLCYFHLENAFTAAQVLFLINLMNILWPVFTSWPFCLAWLLTGRCISDLHMLAVWFILWHLLQSLPYAGQLPLSWLSSQNLQLLIMLTRFRWVCLVTLWTLSPKSIFWSCSDAISLLRHMSTAFVSMSVPSLSKRALVALSQIPMTKRSLSISSDRAPNWQVLASCLSLFTYWSIDSPGSCVEKLNTYL